MIRDDEFGPCRATAVDPLGLHLNALLFAVHRTIFHRILDRAGNDDRKIAERECGGDVVMVIDAEDDVRAALIGPA